jgi:hypothetical protein
LASAKALPIAAEIGSTVDEPEITMLPDTSPPPSAAGAVVPSPPSAGAAVSSATGAVSSVVLSSSPQAARSRARAVTPARTPCRPRMVVVLTRQSPWVGSTDAQRTSGW